MKAQMVGKKAENKAVGRTKGGLNTKIHAIVDGLGNPVAFLLSPGNDNDSTHAIELMKTTDIAGSNLMSVTWGKIPRLSGETFRSTTCKFRQKKMRGTIPTIKSCIFHGNPPNTVHNWDDPQKNYNPIQRTLGGFSRLPEPTGFSRWWFSWATSPIRDSNCLMRWETSSKRSPACVTSAVSSS